MNLQRLKMILMFLIFSTVLSSAFVNCGGFRSDLTYSENNNSSAAADEESLKRIGMQLYAVNCSSCHYDIEYSTKKGRTSAQISQAINSIPNMKAIPSIVSLSSQDILAIELALRNPPDAQAKVSSPSFQQPLGNRLFLSSKMKSLFSNGNADIDAIIDNYILNKGHAFGGVCNRTMSKCDGDETLHLNSEGVPSSTVLRSGYKVKACEAIADNDTAVSIFMTQLNLSANSPRTTPNLSAVFLAMTGVEPTSEILLKFSQFDSVTNNVAIDSWRLIILLVCESSLFENF